MLSPEEVKPTLEAALKAGFVFYSGDSSRNTMLATISEIAALIKANSVPTWKYDELPTDADRGTSFLVMLKEDNPVEWTTERPVMAEWGFERNKNWTVFDPWDHANADVWGFVKCWMPLPLPPLSKE